MSEDDYNLEREAILREQMGKEEKDLLAWMESNGIVAERKESGLFVFIEKPGTGRQPVSGDKVKVNYTGKLLNGQMFDSSLKPGRTPFEFTIGQQQVIAGWDEGLTYFKEGGSGKLIIPSALGYGEQGSGAGIPPNAPLVFDIELLKVN
jgi:FKBP-type peptidyl-prolyl cis-trans isomerase